MYVLDRAALEASPPADLHAIASALSIDGHRPLRDGRRDGRVEPAWRFSYNYGVALAALRHA